MLRLLAPSAMRTPISRVRCSTRYESTLNNPDSVSSSASTPSTTVSQNEVAEDVGVRSRERLHRRDLGHVRVERRESIEDHASRDLGVAAHAQRQRRRGHVGVDRQVDAGSADAARAELKARDVARDADDDGRARLQQRVVGRRRRGSGLGALPDRRVRLDAQHLPDRVGAGPELARHGFRNDGHGFVRVALGVA